MLVAAYFRYGTVAEAQRDIKTVNDQKQQIVVVHKVAQPVVGVICLNAIYLLHNALISVAKLRKKAKKGDT